MPTEQSRTGWHKEDIKAAIRKRGKTMNDLARDYGLPVSNVRNALARPVFSGEKAIATFLDIPPHELWPDRWTPEGRRIRPRYANKYSGSSTVGTVKQQA
ncbi:helix-turn-helix domain-containing protein [Paraburkholderia humisilvae]|uniref:Ner winged helix-turn-helix DNA-binding domain-containing protein n=1 Tax=Paraburkholderia humisilvae TaxID=627669 RepID=A0A6J5ECK4_9BURK|nr:helix-turn-helix transcriptional regulator [Paraburkholderia humisilvae]CAB3764228.1 hypothetical protein LMG29542_04821 [Paraburkholderia humisilvae]